MLVKATLHTTRQQPNYFSTSTTVRFDYLFNHFGSLKTTNFISHATISPQSAKMPPAPPKAPPPGTIPKKPESIPPNQTLYVRGVPSAKIQKEDLRTALYLLFSTYGPVLDVVALKTMKMRGQAHIVYRDIQTATQAMRALDGFEFLGEKIVRSPFVIRIQFGLPS